MPRMSAPLNCGVWNEGPELVLAGRECGEPTPPNPGEEAGAPGGPPPTGLIPGGVDTAGVVEALTPTPAPPEGVLAAGWPEGTADASDGAASTGGTAATPSGGTSGPGFCVCSFGFRAAGLGEVTPGAEIAGAPPVTASAFLNMWEKLIMACRGYRCRRATLHPRAAWPQALPVRMRTG